MGQNQLYDCNDHYKTKLVQEISKVLRPYLDDQVMASVFEARRSGIKDLVIYLDTVSHEIYQLERSEVLSDTGAPEGLRNMLATPSSQAAPFGSEVLGYLSFWFVVNLPDNRLAAMAVSALPNNNSGIN
jgi:hypothetical protein